uniref:Calcineurin-like phosphoesterase domain-containing protein n=1 Tax=Ananas comosus var. bracteatus TaxID=296719 RepID=A0A6V7QWZ7_ANACO
MDEIGEASSSSFRAPPPPDPDRTVICIGDIHGLFSKLRRLWANLEAAVGGAAFETALVVFLGDYCDRGPETREVLEFLVSLPARYPRQRHVYLCGNHEFAFAAFVGALPRPRRVAVLRHVGGVRGERGARGLVQGEGYDAMHVQGRRWGGSIRARFDNKNMPYKGSTYDAAPTFESYGVPMDPPLAKAVPDDHKKFLHDLVWVHEEENVPVDTDEGRICCKLIAVHAGLLKSKGVDERLKLLRARDTRLPKVQELSGRQDVWEIPKVMRRSVFQSPFS